MNSQQVSDLKLLYNAVYDENLREQAEEYNNTVFDEDIVEVATEYFYTYGLNEDGIDILIEKVGLENFVEFVYGLSEDLTVITEARAAKRRKGGESYEDVKAKIDAKEAAKKKAKKAAQERTETERKEPESKGADTEAKVQQSKKRPIRDAIARQVLAGMERHRKAMQLAKETGKTVAKAAAVTHEAGRRAGEHVKKHGLKSLANEEIEGDLFDYLLEYLVAEGYAETNENAIKIMANMSEEWKQSIVEAIDMTKTDAYKNAQTKAATKFYTTPIKPLPPYQARTPRFPALTVPDFDLGTNKPKSPSVRRDDGRTERPVPPRTERPVAPRQKGTESQKPKPQVTPAQPKPEATPYKGPGYKKDTSIQDMIDRSKERQQEPKAQAPKAQAPRQPISAGAAGAEGVKFVERGSSSAAGSPAKPIRDRMVGLSPRERAQMKK
jgi:hypothetical protein